MDKGYNIYYSNYIGYDYKNTIVSNKNLEIPINKNYNYLAIITNINNKEIISINNKYYNDYHEFYKNKKFLYKNNIEIIKEFFISKNIKINIRNMYRMSTNKPLNFTDTEIVFNENKKKCAILKNKNIISYAKISNIDYNGANIVIHTEYNYRNKGYATKLLFFLTNYCLNNNLIPIFLVDINNKASLSVAKKCNYKIMNKEIIISLDN